MQQMAACHFSRGSGQRKKCVDQHEDGSLSSKVFGKFKSI
jgi:hypothetical protein